MTSNPKSPEFSWNPLDWGKAGWHAFKETLGADDKKLGCDSRFGFFISTFLDKIGLLDKEEAQTKEQTKKEVAASTAELTKSFDEKVGFDKKEAAEKHGEKPASHYETIRAFAIASVKELNNNMQAETYSALGKLEKDKPEAFTLDEALAASAAGIGFLKKIRNAKDLHQNKPDELAKVLKGAIEVSDDTNFPIKALLKKSLSGAFEIDLPESLTKKTGGIGDSIVRGITAAATGNLGAGLKLKNIGEKLGIDISEAKEALLNNDGKPLLNQSLSDDQKKKISDYVGDKILPSSSGKAGEIVDLMNEVAMNPDGILDFDKGIEKVAKLILLIDPKDYDRLSEALKA